MQKEELEVDIETLKVIYDTTVPVYFRLNSLLEDLYQKNITLSETNKAVLLDFAACAGTLKILFEEFFSTAPTNESGDKFILARDEFLTIMSLSKTVELSTRTTFSGISIQEH